MTDLSKAFDFQVLVEVGYQRPRLHSRVPVYFHLTNRSCDTTGKVKQVPKAMIFC